MENDIGKMIVNITEKKRPKIVLEAIKRNSNDRDYIMIDKKEIDEHIKEHYEQWTRNREIDLDLLTYDYMWNEIYSPIENIDEDLYKDLMNSITLDELNIVIAESSKDKAAGPSGITYDLWKKSKENTRIIINKLMNECLMEEEFVKKWKKGSESPHVTFR
ncbi:hypothetical protein RhiirC2_819590 [Rhizophagus irregularis]|uniref:Uncharacterized protein n=1 Tax=Rhizophagus irregularis TaxID=588596 RepID=A0A2N1MEC4_9GLOM|nr:hypothetical protein RhiirC2_819590 [Rhizophagus irregularis]